MARSVAVNRGFGESFCARKRMAACSRAWPTVRGMQMDRDIEATMHKGEQLLIEALKELQKTQPSRKEATRQFEEGRRLVADAWGRAQKAGHGDQLRTRHELVEERLTAIEAKLAKLR